MSTLGIIPARGGSKSIPHKNIVDLGGKPLIAYAIAAMRESGVVDRVVVTTDDEEIAAVAKKHGAEVPFMRPKELAEDATPGIPVVEHALSWLEEHERYTPEYVLLIQPTEPFVKPEQIREVLARVQEKGADSGITVVAVPRRHHPFHIREINTDGYLVFSDEQNHYAYPNRQSDPKRYAFGNLYWFKREVFLREKKVEVGKRVGVEIDPQSAHDIDGLFDLELARFLVSRENA